MTEHSPIYHAHRKSTMLERLICRFSGHKAGAFTIAHRVELAPCIRCGQPVRWTWGKPA